MSTISEMASAAIADLRCIGALSEAFSVEGTVVHLDGRPAFQRSSMISTIFEDFDAFH